ncbi:MAG: hypothetical protein JXC85_03680 [Candidatus Aenigmarchaeota archaeon]|nr:hypothetical protein [Candidatus Aenigmarchaeota archaeon]
MSDGIFDFGPIKLDMLGNPNHGKSYGFIYDSEKAINFGSWIEEGTYRNAPADVAEMLNRKYGAEVFQKRCSFIIVHYENEIDIVNDIFTDSATEESAEEGVVTFGYDMKGPNGGRWIDARTLSPIVGIASKPLDREYRHVIELVSPNSE